jgi:hypothetical protein
VSAERLTCLLLASPEDALRPVLLPAYGEALSDLNDAVWLLHELSERDSRLEAIRLSGYLAYGCAPANVTRPGEPPLVIAEATDLEAACAREVALEVAFDAAGRKVLRVVSADEGGERRSGHYWPAWHIEAASLALGPEVNTGPHERFRRIAADAPEAAAAILVYGIHLTPVRGGADLVVDMRGVFLRQDVDLLATRVAPPLFARACEAVGAR